MNRSNHCAVGRIAGHSIWEAPSAVLIACLCMREPTKISPLGASASGDHRVRVGRERREKMRRRLLQAVISSYSLQERYVTPVIADVIKEAQVSRATFYVHFETMEEAINAVGQNLTEEMIHSLEAFFRRSEDPLLRMAMGIQIFLLRSVTDPLWGAFVARTNYLSQDTYLFKTLATDFVKAKQLGYIEFTDIEAATSVFVGSMMEAIRRLVKTDQRSRGYVEEVAVMVLRGLGVDYARAREVVEDRAIFIRGLAPDCLPWWRDPWRT